VRKENKEYRCDSRYRLIVIYILRRGVFNFPGEVSKILFGTMNNEDAEYQRANTTLQGKFG
jgi:hypothetical protein